VTDPLTPTVLSRVVGVVVWAIVILVMINLVFVL
jgi:hypothetical protein